MSSSTAFDRPGPYGGPSLHDRTTFLRRCIDAVRAAAPGLDIGVRLSAFDLVPHRPAEGTGVGEPEPGAPVPYRHAFGGDGTGLGLDLAEPKALLDVLGDLDVHLVCITAGSPYYVPHVQRPAFFPPSDGYLPPEDPLVGVARLLAATAELKAHRPGRHRRRHRATPTSRSGCRTWPPACCATAAPTGSGSAAWCSATTTSPTTCWPDGRTTAGASAARSATARRRPATASCRAAGPLDPFYKLREDRPLLAAAKKASRDGP